MSTTDAGSSGASVGSFDMKVEVVVIPVARTAHLSVPNTGRQHKEERNAEVTCIPACGDSSPGSNLHPLRADSGSHRTGHLLSGVAMSPPYLPGHSSSNSGTPAEQIAPR
jgi:hypothetical protein